MSRPTVEELLVQAGHFSEEQLDFARREHLRTGVHLSRILIDHKLVPEKTYYDTLAQATGLERLNLRAVEIAPEAANHVTAAWALNHNMLPITVDMSSRTLWVAQTDPSSLRGTDELAFRTSMRIKPLIASETELSRLVRYHFYHEPLDRELAQSPQAVDVSDDLIVHGIDGLREEVQTMGARQKLPPGSAELSAVQPPLEALKRLFESQQEAAHALKIIFELCVARGLITREEYLERLKRQQ